MASWPKSKEEQGWREMSGTGLRLGVEGRLSKSLISEGMVARSLFDLFLCFP